MAAINMLSASLWNTRRTDMGLTSNCASRLKMLLASLCGCGIHPDLAPSLAKLVFIANAYAIALCASAVVVASLLFFLQIKMMSLIAVFVGIGFSSVFFLNSRRKYSFSRFMLLLIFNVAIYTFATSLGQASGTHYWFFASAFLPFSIYGIGDIRKLFLATSLAFVSLLFVSLSNFEYNILPILNPGPLISQRIMLVMLTLSFATSVSVVYFFALEHYRNAKLAQFQSQRVIKNHLMALNASCIVEHTDPQGRISYVNDGFVRVSGYSRSELIGMRSSIVNSAFHPPVFFENLWNTINSKKIWKGEIRNKTKSGDFYWVDTTIVPILDEEGRVQEFVSIRHDITDRKMTELQLIQSSKLASLGQMSAGIAHEINNPLAIILGAVSLLPKFADDPDKFKQKIQLVEKSGERISKIIQGLRKFSRTADGVTFEWHSLAKIARESLVLIDAKAKLNSVSVALDIASEASVYCNEVEIEQVLVNLVGNSIDAIKGCNEKWVRVHIFERDAFIVLRVIDSGFGIPAQVRDKIFDPFFTTKGIGEGTGLGLSISKGILDEHGAGIEVLADAVNTCFEVTFKKAELPKSSV